MSSHPMLQCNHSIELTLSSSLKLESSSSGEEVDRDGRGPKCLLLAGQAMSLAKLFLLLSQPPQRQSIMEYQGGETWNTAEVRGSQRETQEQYWCGTARSPLTPPASASLYKCKHSQQARDTGK